MSKRIDRFQIFKNVKYYKITLALKIETIFLLEKNM